MTEQNLTGRPHGRPKVEPSANHRASAKTLYGMYVALVDEGFTDQQALTLVGDLLTAVVSDDDDND